MPDSGWKNKPTASSVTPTGELRMLTPDQIKPSLNNPRLLFDPIPLKELKESINTHGVLVPLTVYQLPGGVKYAIIDGERRYKCCKELVEEGIEIPIPVNIVHAPKKLEQLIYMFNIHSFREQWELMPTALGLKTIIKELNLPKDKAADIEELHQITGLSIPQITRCLKILSFPEKYQNLSLEVDPNNRIPSNFWIEAQPVLKFVDKELPKFSKIQEDGSIEMLDNFVDKYRRKKIKSVIHFRRIMEAIDVSEDDEDMREKVVDRIREFIEEPKLETRQAFDGFIVDKQRINKAIDACDSFVQQLKKSKIDNTIEGRKEIINKLIDTRNYINNLIESMSGDDPNNMDD